MKFYTQEKTQLIEKMAAVIKVIQKMDKQIEVETSSKLIATIEEFQDRVRAYFKLHDEALSTTKDLQKEVQNQEELKTKFNFDVEQQKKGLDPKATNPAVADLLSIGGFNVV